MYMMAMTASATAMMARRSAVLSGCFIVSVITMLSAISAWLMLGGVGGGGGAGGPLMVLFVPLVSAIAVLASMMMSRSMVVALIVLFLSAPAI